MSPSLPPPEAEVAAFRHLRSLAIAYSVLRAFHDNSAYGEYAEEDGWTDEEYHAMLEDFRTRFGPRAAAACLRLNPARMKEVTDAKVTLSEFL